MIVRKYCERKGGRAAFFAKGENKKEFMKEFRSEVADRDWYRCGTK
jgi:hypothetical protein